MGVVGDVGLAGDDGHPLQPRQGDRQGDANVGTHLNTIGLLWLETRKGYRKVVTHPEQTLGS